MPNVKLTTQEVKSRLLAKGFKLLSEYTGWNKKVEVECPLCYKHFTVICNDVLHGNTKSCGCAKIPYTTPEDLTGQTFNDITFISIHPEKNKHGRPQWNVRCKCGTEKVLTALEVKSGNTKSCGCRTHRFGIDNPNFKGRGELTGRFWKTVRRRMKKLKNERDIDSDLTIDEAYDIFVKQNKVCFYTNLPLWFGNSREGWTASLDRIDSSKGYTACNVQWVHADINIMKMDLSHEKFVEYANLISDNMKKKKDSLANP